MIYISSCIWSKVKKYVRKGIPNEHRGRICLIFNGAQEQLEAHPGYYHSLLAAEPDTRLQEVIHIGQHDPGTAGLPEVTLLSPPIVQSTNPFKEYLNVGLQWRCICVEHGSNSAGLSLCPRCSLG